MSANGIIYLLAAIALFMGGYHSHDYLHTCPVPEAPTVVAESKSNVDTELAYEPKTDKADIDIKIAKPELNVKVNDKEYTFQKEADESYVFDKNKLTLSQTSRAELHIAVPEIDKTRRYSVGIGMSKDGLVGLIDFPVSKKEYIGCWVAGNEDYQMAGVTIRF